MRKAIPDYHSTFGSTYELHYRADARSGNCGLKGTPTMTLVAVSGHTKLNYALRNRRQCRHGGNYLTLLGDYTIVLGMTPSTPARRN